MGDLQKKSKGIIKKICTEDRIIWHIGSKKLQFWGRFKTKKSAKDEMEYVTNNHPYKNIYGEKKVVKSKCNGYVLYVGRK